MLSRLLLVHHAPLQGQTAGRLSGRMDIPLVAEYRDEMNRAAEVLRREQCQAVVSSSLAQARMCGDYVAQILQVPLVVDSDLADLDLGAWNGKRLEDLEQEDCEGLQRLRQWDPTFALPGGEPLRHFVTRIIAATRRLEDRVEERIAVVSHGRVITQILCHLMGLAPRQHRLFQLECGKVTRIDVFGDRGVLSGLNLG